MGLTLSYSKITTYQSCPLKYKFYYLDKIPTPPKFYFTFGNTLHKVVEFFYKDSTLRTVEEILTYYHQQWSSEGFNPRQEQSYKAEGELILRRFHEKYSLDYQAPLYCEYPITLTLGEVRVNGIIDRLDNYLPTGVKIVDYKTGKTFTPENISNNLQLIIYQLAIEQSLGLKVLQVCLYHLNTNTEYCVPGYSQDQLNYGKHTILEVANLIGQGKFQPSYEASKCNRCDYREICPAYKEQSNDLVV